MGDCFIFCDLLRKPELYLPKRHKNISCSRSLAIRIFECIEIMVNSNEIDFFFKSYMLLQRYGAFNNYVDRILPFFDPLFLR